MDKIIKTIMRYFGHYIICLLCVSAAWVGLEYIFEGVVHSSNVDGFIAIILSLFITDKFMGGN